MIVYTAWSTFIILKLVGIFVPLRLSDEELEIGDHAIHGNEVYPSDVPTLGGPARPRVAARRSRRSERETGGGRARRRQGSPIASARPRFGGVALAAMATGPGAAALAAADRACALSAAARLARGRPTGQLTPVPPEAAVAAGVLGEVLLVVVLGVVERAGLAAESRS